MTHYIHQQRPRGGCANCGSTVRTRKRDGWVCARCQAELARRLRVYATPEPPISELELRALHGDR